MDNDAFVEYSRSSHHQPKIYQQFFKKYGTSFQRIVDRISKKKIHCSFLEYLIKNTKFSQCAIACIGSNSETAIWFKNVCCTKSIETIQEFTYACQKIVSKILHLFLETYIASSDRSRFSSLWYNIYDSIDTGFMFGKNGPFSNLPEGIKDRTGLYLVLEYMVKMVEKWIYESEEKSINNVPSNCEKSNQ